MGEAWEASRQAFGEAAAWFVSLTAEVGDRWEQPGLGEWDVRALVGHTSRSFVTVESYLAQPPATVEIASTVAYYRATSAIAAGPGVAQRGRDAGAALGEDPAGAVAEIADRVLRLVASCDGTELLSSIVGGIRLADYLPTRVFELTVHTCDLAVALSLPLDVPPVPAAQALTIASDLALADGRAAQLLLLATGRASSGFSVL